MLPPSFLKDAARASRRPAAVAILPRTLAIRALRRVSAAAAANAASNSRRAFAAASATVGLVRAIGCPSRTNHGHDRQGSFSRLLPKPQLQCVRPYAAAPCHADGSQSLCLKGGVGRDSSFYTPDRPRDCRDDCCPQHRAIKTGFTGSPSILFLPISSWLRVDALATCRFSPSPRSSQVSPGRARL